jgi:hypothetical protein
VFFQGRLAVPKVQSLLDQILKEAHDTPLYIHPGDAIFEVIDNLSKVAHFCSSS